MRNLPPGDVLGYLHCTVRLAGGSVVFEGPITFADLVDGNSFAVLGGTGRYEGFGGEVVVAPAAGGASLDFAFTKR